MLAQGSNKPRAVGQMRPKVASRPPSSPNLAYTKLGRCLSVLGHVGYGIQQPSRLSTQRDGPLHPLEEEEKLGRSVLVNCLGRTLRQDAPSLACEKLGISQAYNSSRGRTTTFPRESREAWMTCHCDPR